MIEQRHKQLYLPPALQWLHCIMQLKLCLNPMLPLSLYHKDTLVYFMTVFTNQARNFQVFTSLKVMRVVYYIYSKNSQSGYLNGVWCYCPHKVYAVSFKAHFQSHIP